MEKSIKQLNNNQFIKEDKRCITMASMKFISIITHLKTTVTCLLLLSLNSGLIVKANATELAASMPSFSPFASFDENKTCKGVISLILSNILTKSKISFNLVNYPYARILHSLESGALDSALVFKNQSIAPSVEYLGPVSKSKVIVISSANIDITRYQDLLKLEAIAVIRNAQFDDQFDNDKTLNKVSVDSYKQAMVMLKFNRVDAVIGSLVGIEYAVHQQELEQKLLDTEFTVGEKEWWLHLSKKSLYIKDKATIDLAIKHFYKDDLVYQLYRSQLKTCLAKN